MYMCFRMQTRVHLQNDFSFLNKKTGNESSDCKHYAYNDYRKGNLLQHYVAIYKEERKHFHKMFRAGAWNITLPFMNATLEIGKIVSIFIPIRGTF